MDRHLNSLGEPFCAGKQNIVLALLLLLDPVLAAHVCRGQEPQATDAGFRVSTNFEGGSADVLKLEGDKRFVHIQPRVVWEHGWPCWWYLKLEGLQVGEEVALKVTSNPRPYRRGAVLKPHWSQPDRAAISSDNVRWSQTPICERVKYNVAVYRFKSPAKQVWLAWGPPFLPTHAEELLARVAKTSNRAVRFRLALTRGGRDVPAIRLDGGTTRHPPKYGVWVQARQHAWEAGSSWVGQGFIEWVAGDERAARELRRETTIWFVPIMDIDRVAIGAGGKESVPQDHNRDWTDHPYYPAVAAAQAQILEADQAERFDLFLDLHNPGPSSRRLFFQPVQSAGTFGPWSPQSQTVVENCRT